MIGAISTSPQSLSSLERSIFKSRPERAGVYNHPPSQQGEERTHSGSTFTQLFIGGMSNNSDLIALQDYLRAICSSSPGLYISIVKRLKRKTFSGYGIIKNITSEDAELMLRISNFKFDGCWYGIKPFLKKKSEINSLRLQRTSKKIYIRGISDFLTETELEHYFSRYGEVLHIQIGKHQGSGISKGFGFIEFESAQASQTVIKIGRHNLSGVEVTCEQSKNHKVSSKESGVSKYPTTSPVSSGKELMAASSQPGIFFRPPKCSTRFRTIADLLIMSKHIDRNHAEGNLEFRLVTGGLQRS